LTGGGLLGRLVTYDCRGTALPAAGSVIRGGVRDDKDLIHHLSWQTIFIESNHPVVVRTAAKAVKPKRSGDDGGTDLTDDRNAIRQSPDRLAMSEI
jgi:hypothetical protein